MAIQHVFVGDYITANYLSLHGEIAFLPNCLLFASLPPACAAEAARHALKCAIACTTSCQLIITCFAQRLARLDLRAAQKMVWQHQPYFVHLLNFSRPDFAGVQLQELDL